MITRLILAGTLTLGPIQVTAFEEIHRCDEVAAHPADSDRWASGVSDGDIIPAPAIAFCGAAASEHPEVARFRFQLARAYWAAGRHDAAVPLLLVLAEDEHGPSLAYLSTALARGLGGAATDPDLAARLADRAAAAGFVAAVPVTTEAAAPAATTFNPALYNQPGVIGALHDGQFETMRVSGIGQTMDYVPLAQEMLYLSGLHNSFASPISRVLDRECVLLHKPAVGERIVARVMNDAFGGKAGMGSRDGMAQQGWAMIGRMMSDIAKGDMGSMMQKERNTELLRQMGEQDGERLLVAHGCASDVTRRIYANLEAFVTGSPPVTPVGGEVGGAAVVESQNASTLRKKWNEHERRREIEAARQRLIGND